MTDARERSELHWDGDSRTAAEIDAAEHVLKHPNPVHIGPRTFGVKP